MRKVFRGFQRLETAPLRLRKQPADTPTPQPLRRHSQVTSVPTMTSNIIGSTLSGNLT